MSDAMFLYGILYLEINLVSAVLLVMIRRKTLGLTRMEAQRYFSLALDVQMLFFFSDALAMLVQTGILKAGPAVLLGAKTVYFLCSCLMCYFWFLYFESITDSPFIKKQSNIIRSSVFVWIMAVLLGVNLFTGSCFFIASDGTYQRGPLFPLLYLLAYLYVVYECGRAFMSYPKEESYSRRETLRSVALFPLLPAAAGILQFIWPQLPLLCAALSLESLLLYLNWTESLISMDPLTRLNNRRQLEYQYNTWKKNASENECIQFLMIDADRFKQINDTYGHNEGDRALMRIAEAMRLSCANRDLRTCIARFGGDEFSILLWSDDPSEAQKLAEAIRRNVEDLNRQAGSRYELHVSIGICTAQPHMSLRLLVQNADSGLYEEKKKRP